MVTHSPEAGCLLGEKILPRAEAGKASLRGWLEQPLRGCTRGFVTEVTVVLHELVRNASEHAEPPIHIRLEMPPAGRVLRIEVRDSSTCAASGWPLGRGLRLVRGLCPDWGVEQVGKGKVVWAELPVLVPPEQPARVRALRLSDGLREAH